MSGWLPLLYSFYLVDQICWFLEESIVLKSADLLLSLKRTIKTIKAMLHGKSKSSVCNALSTSQYCFNIQQMIKIIATRYYNVLDSYGLTFAQLHDY